MNPGETRAVLATHTLLCEGQREWARACSRVRASFPSSGWHFFVAKMKNDQSSWWHLVSIGI